MSQHKPLHLVEEHEGSILYTDSNLQAVRTLAALTVIMYHDPATNQYRSGWSSTGYLIATLEALALYCVANPGMKEALDGMYVLAQKRFQALQAGGGEAKK